MNLLMISDFHVTSTRLFKSPSSLLKHLLSSLFESTSPVFLRFWSLMSRISSWCLVYNHAMTLVLPSLILPILHKNDMFNSPLSTEAGTFVLEMYIETFLIKYFESNLHPVSSASWQWCSSDYFWALLCPLQAYSTSMCSQRRVGQSCDAACNLRRIQCMFCSLAPPRIWAIYSTPCTLWILKGVHGKDPQEEFRSSSFWLRCTFRSCFYLGGPTMEVIPSRDRGERGQCTLNHHVSTVPSLDGWRLKHTLLYQ